MFFGRPDRRREIRVHRRRPVIREYAYPQEMLPMPGCGVHVVPSQTSFLHGSSVITPYPSFEPTVLLSRVLALNHRSAAVIAHLEHLSTVIEPLKTVKEEEITEDKMYEMRLETCTRGWHAVQQLEALMHEIGLILEMLEEGG